MILKPGFGIDQLLFGMKQPDVITLYGEPSRKYNDDDDNVVFVYNDKRLRLTFYAEEDFRLGYLITSIQGASVKDVSPIGKSIKEAITELKGKGFTKWTSEDFDTYENFINEDNWLILQSEFGEVVKVELGAFINEKTDEFVWKVK